MKLSSVFASIIVHLVTAIEQDFVQEQASDYHQVVVNSKTQKQIPIIPKRYHPQSPHIDLFDSGILETELQLGASGSQEIKAMVSVGEKGTSFPANFLERFQSASLSITSSGRWKDILQLGSLSVPQEFSFVGQEAVLGLNADWEDDPSPFCVNIISRRMLSMSLFSLYLHKEEERVRGELVMGEILPSKAGAPLRYNPVISTSEGGWALKLVDLRVDGEYLGAGLAGGIIRPDTTTPFVIMPQKAFKAISKLLQIPFREVKDVLLSRPQDCAVLRENLPALSLAIATDEFLWDAQRYTLAQDDGQCLLAFAGYDIKDDEQRDIWILGSSFFFDRVAVFDYEVQHIGLTDYEPDAQIAEALRSAYDAEAEAEDEAKAKVEIENEAKAEMDASEGPKRQSTNDQEL